MTRRPSHTEFVATQFMAAPNAPVVTPREQSAAPHAREGGVCIRREAAEKQFAHRQQVCPSLRRLRAVASRHRLREAKYSVFSEFEVRQ